MSAVIGQRVGYRITEQDGGLNVVFLDENGNRGELFIPNVVPSEAFTDILNHRKPPVPQRQLAPRQPQRQQVVPPLPAGNGTATTETVVYAKCVFRGTLEECQNYLMYPIASDVTPTEPATHFVMQFPDGKLRISTVEGGQIPQVGESIHGLKR